jgi:starch synthase
VCYNKIVKILFVSAEVAPFVTVGGLSQVLYFLPQALRDLDHDVRIFTPKYGKMNMQPLDNEKDLFGTECQGLKVPIDPDAFDSELVYDKKDYLLCNVKLYENEKRNSKVYFLENREYYELRANVFGYMDDHVRFGLLSKGVLEWLLQCNYDPQGILKDNWWPDIIHCNDWHTSYVIDMARRDARYKDVFAKTAFVLTVHNFAYQGNYDFRYPPKEHVDTGAKPLASLLSPKFQTQNALMRGLLYADAINTVSPTHAIEVLTPEYAEGLSTSLEKVRGKLTGILNGLDTIEFNPNTDPIISATYNEKSFAAARKENKSDLQKLFRLPVDPQRPLFAFLGRLWIQKGVDLLIETLPRLFTHRPDAQMIILGGGDDRYRTALTELQKKYPHQLGLHLQPDFRLPRKIFAGSDIFIIPSYFEPGGIVALEALRYGTVPIVRRTGGLNDIIEDFNPVTGKGNGFSFNEKDPWALFASMIEALTVYKQSELWEKLVTNCLECDYSWNIAAKEYNNWYHHILEERRRAASPIPHPAYSTAIVVQ